MASLIGAFDNPFGYWNMLTLKNERQEQAAPWRDQYRLLKAYARNNGLYDVLRQLFQGHGFSPPDIVGLRNPANRVEAFYAAKLWPGPLPRALPIETDNQALIPVIEQIWLWSNWANAKQAAARQFATCGDMFLKAATNADENGQASRVFIQRLDPEVVTYFEADERGFLTYVRLDTPITERTDRGLEPYMLTEVWDKDTQTMRLWKHKHDIDTEIDRLGEPLVAKDFGTFGIDFVPIVWQPFRDIGEERGEGAFTPALDKIDEANRQAHRLYRMLFRNNRVLWAIMTNQADKEGRPVPPPRITEGQVIRIADEDDPMFEIPGGQMVPLVPNINYADALAVLQDHMADIQSDLPELAYYTLRNRTDLSGRALRILLSDALDRLIEARGNAESALVRAHQMCITIGQHLDLFDRTIGTFENGDLEHSIAKREVFTPDEFEIARTFQTYASGGMPTMSAARLSGLNEEQLDLIESDMREEQERNAQMAEAAIAAAQRRFDQEDAQNGE